jgi:dipeptidase E
MKLLLIGATGSPPFDHCRDEIIDFLGQPQRVGLITAANLFDEEAYFRTMDERLIGIAPQISRKLIHIRCDSNWRDAMKRIDAVIVPGGNTYALLKRLYQSGLFDALRESIQNGLPYVGSSAGANIAGPNILTTNDWNVIGSNYFDSLGLVPFNINPHYVGGSEAPNAETRDLRIREYHQVQQNAVVGLEEGAVLRVVSARAPAVRKGRAKVILRDNVQRWFQAGEDLVFGTEEGLSGAAAYASGAVSYGFADGR